MALFRKDDSKEKVPTELEQYYDRPLWQIWLRRILVVIITAVLVLGVFMLGRAVYRSVTDDGDSQGSGQTTQQADEDSGSNENSEAEQKQAAEDTANQNQAMPRTGDDPTDQPGNVTETLPATGG